MRIACLGWGSLIWKWHPLRLVSPWLACGPLLPIEFARESEGGELATVICPGAVEVPVLWARLGNQGLDEACDLLRKREKIPADRIDGVGCTPTRDGCVPGPFDERIAAWATTREIDAVIWTALPPKSHGVEGRAQTADEAVAYLTSLEGKARAHAEDYVRRVPPAISTRNRTAIENRLGWFATGP